MQGFQGVNLNFLMQGKQPINTNFLIYINKSSAKQPVGQDCGACSAANARFLVLIPAQRYIGLLFMSPLLAAFLTLKNSNIRPCYAADETLDVTYKKAVFLVQFCHIAQKAI